MPQRLPLHSWPRGCERTQVHVEVNSKLLFFTTLLVCLCICVFSFCLACSRACAPVGWPYMRAYAGTHSCMRTCARKRGGKEIRVPMHDHTDTYSVNVRSALLCKIPRCVIQTSASKSGPYWNPLIHLTSRMGGGRLFRGVSHDWQLNTRRRLSTKEPLNPKAPNQWTLSHQSPDFEPWHSYLCLCPCPRQSAERTCSTNGYGVRFVELCTQGLFGGQGYG